VNGRVPSYGGLLLTMVFWGGAFPASKWATEQMPHAVAALLRFGGGTVVLLVAVAVLRPRLPGNRSALIRAGLVGLIGVFGYNTLFFWGVTMAPANDGSVIFPAMVPVFTALALVTSRRETAPRRRVAGLGLGVAGAAAFFVAADLHAPHGSHRVLGDVIFVVGAVVWAAYTLLSRAVVRDIEPAVATAAATLCGSVALALFAVPDYGNVRWSGLSGGFWLNIAFLAIAPTAVAYLLYARGIRDVGAGIASAMMFTVPVFGTFFSFVFLGESFNPVQAVAAVLMLVGAYFAATSGESIVSPRPQQLTMTASTKETDDQLHLS
jgi:drug/metabolite transporter (DMT)-like permease